MKKFILFYLLIILFSAISAVYGQAALQFDGIDDRATIPYNNNYNVNAGNFTIEVWVSLQNKSGEQIIISNRTSGIANGFLLMTWGAGTKVLLQIAGMNLISNSFTNIVDNTCHHIAVSRNSGVVSFYVDGIYRGGGSFSYTFKTSSNLWLGNDAYNLNQYTVKGKIDEVRFWNIARTQTDINNNKGIDLPATNGLLGYWKLNETGSQAINDNGLLGNSGILGTTSGIDSYDPARTSASCTSAGCTPPNGGLYIQPDNGSNQYCKGTYQTFTVRYPNEFTNFNWIAYGATIYAGQGTSTVTIYFDYTSAGGALQVIAIEQCRQIQTSTNITFAVNSCGSFRNGNNNSTDDNLEFEDSEQTCIYPNPASENVYFKLAATEEFIDANIYAITGQLIKSFNISKERSVDIRDIPQGLYIVEFKNKYQITKTIRLEIKR